VWTDEQRKRYHFLSEREQANELTAAEAAELAALVQDLCDHEAEYLAPANERKAREMAAVTEAVQQIEIENRQLREYLSARLAFLDRVKSIVSQIQAEDQAMRERFAAVLPSGDIPPPHSPS
jgi:predicted nuclease with TOPRIM domain